MRPYSRFIRLFAVESITKLRLVVRRYQPLQLDSVQWSFIQMEIQAAGSNQYA